MREVRSIPAVPVRRADAHKGDFGRALVVGGSVGLAGAPMLAAAGALRSGAGLVELAVPWSVYLAAAARLPSALVVPLEETPSGQISMAADASQRQAEMLCRRADAVAIGPGLGTGDGPSGAVGTFLQFSEVSSLVVDADALNALAEAPALWDRRRGQAAILTPHPGEMARLAGTTSEKVQADRVQAAVGLARARRATVVLKGRGTVVTDGDRIFENTTGSHGLARGGTGDVLTGVLAALLAQGMDPFDAAVLGVHAHGLAGDLAQERLGAMGMTADDVVEALPAAWKRLEGR